MNRGSVERKRRSEMWRGGEQVALLSVCAGKGDAVDKVGLMARVAAVFCSPQLYLRTIVRSSAL
jgi:hypothetical protein